ncbi:ABC transporter ATP-binding protein [Tsukamurella asaccharolytica]|uniref:ABC transporter ATP-binding protein n=1 Tax=Tsukamurella asaccharolytica TaxID=2592067 RepID=A0A5C5R5K3_9ACTN|nr:ABC transporter ATP-binding protein [Tsukamurella asaccharolytica]TWS18078.1 ABC transporter ATP-binding protein [Tsukamurella asaccharolytica]
MTDDHPDRRGVVDIRELGVEYRKARSREPVIALSETTAHIDAGAFVTLLGASGCGKSTLLNAIAGFVLPSHGSIEVDGRPVRGPGPDRAVVFQQYALLPWLTARANIEFALKRFALPRAEQRERALAALEAVNLGHAADSLPAELSGGMQQRVSMARALAAEPDVLLMDEPFGALDAITRAVMQELILEIWERTSTTILFVTHDVDEALFLSQRILLMSAQPGRVTEDISLIGADEPALAETRRRIVSHLGGH